MLYTLYPGKIMRMSLQRSPGDCQCWHSRYLLWLSTLFALFSRGIIVVSAAYFDPPPHTPTHNAAR
ncbi:hypothetical protein Hanom_Chr14g01296681 [Helianthus anomalus]